MHSEWAQQWLQTQLEQLGPQDKRLLEGHWFEGRSWKELALELRLSCRQAQQRGETLLGWLQAAAGHVPASTSQSAIASRAAMAV